MKWVDRLAMFSGLVAGYVLFGVMLFVVISILFRYVLGQPIFGSQDLLEMALICVTLFGMAYCARSNGHIAVDLCERQLGRVGCLVGDALSRMLGITLLGLLTWGAGEKMLDAWTWGDATNLLQIPFWPFYGLILFSTFLYALALLVELTQILRPGVTLELLS
jgi:TRAP-type C4-dicarboxylate transport system permease small subunit